LTRWRVLLCAFLVSCSAFAATDTSSDRTFAAGVTALERGAWDEAIDQFELLADRGFVHPDASFNRAVAYVERARGSGARPGDLGRAAAALSETLELRPGDSEAEAGLERVHSEIARRRARDGSKPITARPSLARAVTALLPERIWAAGAAIGSLGLSVGLLLGFSGKRRRRLAARITASVGAFVLIVTGGLTLAARRYRLQSQHAVVVTPEARLLDETGAPISAAAQREGSTIPEGESVYVLERRAELARVEWGTTSGWVQLAQIRILATP
jgi:hypothetical protein